MYSPEEKLMKDIAWWKGDVAKLKDSSGKSILQNLETNLKDYYHVGSCCNCYQIMGSRREGKLIIYGTEIGTSNEIVYGVFGEDDSFSEEKIRSFISPNTALLSQVDFSDGVQLGEPIMNKWPVRFLEIDQYQKKEFSYPGSGISDFPYGRMMVPSIIKDKHSRNANLGYDKGFITMHWPN